MKYARNQNLSAIKSDGTLATPDKDGLITFPSTGTWFIEIGSTDAPMCEEVIDIAVQLKWSAAFAATGITFEWTNFPATRGNQSQQGAADVASNENAGTGFWVQDNDASGDKLSPPIGTGNTITNLTIVAGGTNAGAVGVQLKDRSARRYRLKLVVTVVGTMRVVANGKCGS